MRTYLYAEEVLAKDTMRTSRGDHSLVWSLPDCHGIVAVLLVSGKQVLSGLLHTLFHICVCWLPKCRVAISHHLLHTMERLLVFPATHSHTSIESATLCHCVRVLLRWF